MKQLSLRFILLTLLTVLLPTALCIAQENAAESRPDSLKVSLLICDAGPEIFELYGHAALRVTGQYEGRPVDEVYNYGVFDFTSPGFVYRFVKGETDYMAQASPTPLFLYSYAQRRSRVTLYQLNFTKQETDSLLAILRHDADPRFCTYRYQYFSRNCSTRILDDIDAAMGVTATYSTDTTADYHTYRQMLKQLNAGYPWYQLGIDMALGSSIDRPIQPREQAFAPVVLASNIDRSRRADGSPLVEGAEVLYPGEGDMRLPATPWYLSPDFILTLVGLIAVGIVYIAYRRGKSPRILWAAWGVICGLPGCLIWFLVFMSEHEGTSPNWLALWLNPLWLLVPCLCWSKRLAKPLSYLFLLQALLALATFIICKCGVQTLNTALIPMLGATLVITLRAYWQLTKNK